MAIGDSTVQIVTAPIDATSIKTAVDAAIAVISTVSGSYFTTSFNDGRGLAVIGVQYQ